MGEFLQCGVSTKYDIVLFFAVLDLDTIQQPTSYCKMNAAIRYRTPCLINKRDPLIISFVLGNDVFLRWVLDLPTLLTLGGSIALV